MDQLKVFLRQLRKHHFWLLSGLAAIVGFVCWWMGSSSLASATQANRATVEKSYSDLDGIDKSAHPANGRFSEGVTVKNDDLKKQVLDEWRQRYDQQQKLFGWPDLVAADIARLKPGDPIPADVRTIAKNNELFLEELQEKVFKTADYRRPKAQAVAPKDAARPAADAPAGEERAAIAADDPSAETEGLVVWSRGHREALELRYNLRRQSGTPSPLNIRLAQEDIWMLENLAKVIRKTNEGAADVIAVPIKRIDSLEIAQWAINDAVRESPKVFEDKATESGGGGLGGIGNTQSGLETPPENAEEREKQLDDELLNGRYISDQGEPLAAADPAPYAEFKLMFVRMKVVIDQRKIPDLLVNCANAPIPIEVVRFWMDEPLVAPSGKAGSAPAGGGGRGLGGMTRGGSGGITGNTPPAGGGQQGGDRADDVEATPSDVTVEVCGLVQIYTPPDEAQLGSGSATDPGKRPAGVPAATVKPPRTSGGSSSNPFSGSRGN